MDEEDAVLVLRRLCWLGRLSFAQSCARWSKLQFGSRLASLPVRLPLAGRTAIIAQVLTLPAGDLTALESNLGLYCSAAFWHD